jgi:hypothetical protein
VLKSVMAVMAEVRRHGGMAISWQAERWVDERSAIRRLAKRRIGLAAGRAGSRLRAGANERLQQRSFKALVESIEQDRIARRAQGIGSAGGGAATGD